MRLSISAISAILLLISLPLASYALSPPVVETYGIPVPQACTIDVPGVGCVYPLGDCIDLQITCLTPPQGCPPMCPEILHKVHVERLMQGLPLP